MGSLAELASELLVCSAAINHLITGMVEYETIHGSPVDAPPLAQVAFSLVHGVAADRVRQPDRDLHAAATIVREIAAAVREDIYVVNPDAFPDADLN